MTMAKTGLTAGRLVLHILHRWIPEGSVVFLYAALAIGQVDLHPNSLCLKHANRLEVVVWVVPSLIGDAIAVSIIGFFLGPMYPIIMSRAFQILPRWLLTVSIGWIAGMRSLQVFPR